MIKGGKGGANTNIFGLRFEQKTDVKTLFGRLKGYEVRGNDLYFHRIKVAEIYKKGEFYTKFLSHYNINWKDILGKKLLPDEAIFVLQNNTLFIVEKKFQHRPGSVDEKLQTCQFKLRQYKKLLVRSNKRVEYGYVLNNWFKRATYRDVLGYIIDVNCFYYFNVLPFEFLGLPTPLRHKSRL